MQEEKLQKGAEEIRAIKMTTLEKKIILEKVLSSLVGEQPIKSPYKFGFMQYASAFCLLLVLSGGVVFASGGSLPGNILYPLKVSIVEPIRAALTFSPEAKIQYETGLTTKRLTEAKTLAAEGKLDLPKEQELSALLDIHARAVTKATLELHKKEPISTTDKNSDTKDKKVDNAAATNTNVTANSQVGIDAHAELLDIVNGQKKKEEGAVLLNTELQLKTKNSNEN